MADYIFHRLTNKKIMLLFWYAHRALIPGTYRRLLGITGTPIHHYRFPSGTFPAFFKIL